MEPCDEGLYLEKNVFPKKFKYKILKKRKIDSQNFECDLRIALNDCEDVREWLKLFKGNTNTDWLLRQNTKSEENVLCQLYVCRNSSFGIKRKYDDDEGSKSDFNCRAAISVKIKKGGKRNYYQDEYVKRGYKGIMNICFIHTHLIDKAEVLNIARESEETERAFRGYFTEGMSPSEAIRNHEEILLLEGHEDLGNSRKNPPEHWVYSLYEEWTKAIENRLLLESQLTRAPVFWKLQTQSVQPPMGSKSKNIVKLCKMAEVVNGMQIPADLQVSDDDDDDESDSENQYDSYDEDSTPQVSSTSYVSVSSTTHQSTVSSAPLKLNVSSKINITRGCTLQVIKNNSGNVNKPSANVRPLFVRVAKGTNTSQGNSVQIITTSHENNKKSALKFLTVSANSRKYTDVESGKTLHLISASKVNIAPGKTSFIPSNSKEHQNVSESLQKSGNIRKINYVNILKGSNESNLKTKSNLKPVKSKEIQKEAQSVLNNILTTFEDSDDIDNVMPSRKNKQTFHMNTMPHYRSDVPDMKIKPTLTKNDQNFVHNPNCEKLIGTDNILNEAQNKGVEMAQNSLKQVSKNVNNSAIQPTPVQRVITVTRHSILPGFCNSSIDKKKDKNDLKNSKEHKSKHFVGSKLLSYNSKQPSNTPKDIIYSDQIITVSNGDSFNSQVSNLVTKSYCDISQACSSSSFENLSEALNQFGSVQSIQNPISSVHQSLDLSRPMLYSSNDSIQKLPQHDTIVSSRSDLCHGSLFNEVNQDSAFKKSKSLEGVPIIQSCPFPLSEDFSSILTEENSSPYLGNKNGDGRWIFPIPFSKDLYSSIGNSSGHVLDCQNDPDDLRYSLLLPVGTFYNSSDQQNANDDLENHSISNDLSFSLHDPDFSDNCNDINSSQLPVDLDMSNDQGLQQIFPDLSKLDELNSFNFPSTEQVNLCNNQILVSNNFSLINTDSNSPPKLQVNPVSLIDNCEDNILPLPDNLKGNIEDINILKNILMCSKLENKDLEDFFHQPENYNQKDVLEKWDSEMCRVRSLLEQNIHDKKLMRAANQFLERIKESVITPSELAIFFSSACNLRSEEKKY